MSSFGPCDVDVKITGCMGYTKKTGGTLVFDDRGVNWVDKLQSNQTIPFNAYYPRIKRIAKTPRLNKLKLCLSDNNEGDGIEIIFENKTERDKCFNKLLMQFKQSQSFPKKKKKKRKRKSPLSSSTKKQKTTASVKLVKLVKVFSSDKFVNKIPEDVWNHLCQLYLDFEDYAAMRRTNKGIARDWLTFMKKFFTNPIIRVPQTCRTLERALAFEKAHYDKNEYDERVPLKIVLDNGIHEIVGNERGMVNVIRSHITFVGQDQTTIRGGFNVGWYGEDQQDVRFEKLAVTNPRGPGFTLRGNETTVDMLKCAVKGCGNDSVIVQQLFGQCDDGMLVQSGATVTATQCEFMENGGRGVYCTGANTKVRLTDCTMHHNDWHGVIAHCRAVVNLHGTKTDIHSNKQVGICAAIQGKVNIHLPSQHNTSHGNVSGDRHQNSGGSIANINADGTFTHVE